MQLPFFSFAQKSSLTDWVWIALRLSLGWIMLWAFLDKTFGLGFSTAPEMSWLSGASPTTGYLQFAPDGPLAALFNSLAGNPVVDWLFMLGLLGVGAALLLGMGMRVASVAGSVMMLLIWLSALPLENNPFIDQHIVYILILIGLYDEPAAHSKFSLAQWWQQTELVRKHPWLT